MRIKCTLGRLKWHLALIQSYVCMYLYKVLCACTYTKFCVHVRSKTPSKSSKKEIDGTYRSIADTKPNFYSTEYLI